ncbi:MAG: hypothetical protein CMJ78_21200 [Planctomycetaceae bacterium]|nr:hypothetical protein [Planctomycetaceae bacterium]
MTHLSILATAFAILVSSTLADEKKTLPGTKPLITTADLPVENLKAVDRFLLKLVEQSVASREKLWKRDYSSREAYRQSILKHRESLRRRIGAVDQRRSPSDIELRTTLNKAAVIAETDHVKIMAVRWRVFDRVHAEGLLLEPKSKVKALIVAMPDADQTPEMLAGLDAKAPANAAFARRIAESGCRVLVPTIIDRNTTWSGNPRVRMMNQTHREFIYRQSFFMGRHLIGYELQKVMAAVDSFQNLPTSREWPIGVVGYGEGGLIAFYAAAIDDRINSVLVSGYFQPREQVHKEPVYRNVYGLLKEFGDAEIASLIAPRSLIIEACQVPSAPDPPPLVNSRNFAAYGKLTTPKLSDVKREFARARIYYEKLGVTDKLSLISSGDGTGPFATSAALKAFLDSFGIDAAAPHDPGKSKSAEVSKERMKRQIDELIDHTQHIVRQSRFRRQEFWRPADHSSVKRWQETTKQYRDLLWDEVIGRLPKADMPPNARTRLVYDTPKWRGYEVILDVYRNVTTYGMLLVPKDMKTDERRPVVVAQHGRNGTPSVICDPHKDTRAYHSYGAKLADEGYVVYAPQNLYLGEEHYRTAQRKAFALGMTIFAPMVRQHEQVLAWLGSLPFVNSKRIGFYGLSYGGKSAMLIPAVLDGYCLSICSGDFNEQVWKHTSIEDGLSFMMTLEHEHTEFDFGERFNYSEVAGLIAPRPFMVERGHHDGVAPDEWVAYEYAKVRRLYVALGIADRTTIEFFNGRHEINAKGTFDFLNKHLDWPSR